MTTKFSLGDVLYYIQDLRMGYPCPHCKDGYIHKFYYTVKGPVTVHRVSITASTSGSTTDYTFTDTDYYVDFSYSNEDWLFSTKEEAEAKAKELNEELAPK